MNHVINLSLSLSLSPPSLSHSSSPPISLHPLLSHTVCVPFYKYARVRCGQQNTSVLLYHLRNIKHLQNKKVIYGTHATDVKKKLSGAGRFLKLTKSNSRSIQCSQQRHVSIENSDCRRMLAKANVHERNASSLV